MSVAGKSMAGLMQKLIPIVCLIHACIYTHTRLHTSPSKWTCVSRDEAEAGGNKMQSARRQSSSEAANAPDGKLSKQKQVFKFTEAISVREELREQLEVLRPRHTHTSRGTHRHYKLPGVRWSVAER